MEDIKRRLDYRNKTVQLQAVEKLYLNIKKKISSDSILSSNIPESPELKLLWQYTGFNQDFVAHKCCQVLIQLVKEGLADFTYVMNGFLNQVPAAKNLSGIIEGLSQMLVLQLILVNTKGDNYVCPYGIRNPPHPFVTVLTNRPTESWPLIIEQVERLSQHSESSVRTNVLKMFDPVIKYIMLDPNCSEQFWRIRSALRTRLISIVGHLDDVGQRDKYLQYLLDLMSNMQMKTAEDTAEIVQFCVQVLNICCNNGDIDLELGERTVTYSLELCQILQQSQADAYCILKSLEQLSLLRPEILCNDINICVLGELLLNSIDRDRVSYLSIVKCALENGLHKISPICSGFVALATINIIATPPSSVGGAKYKTPISLAGKVTQLLEEYCLNKNDEVMSYKSHDYNMLTGSSYTVQSCVQLARNFTFGDGSLKQWLSIVDQHIKQMQTVPLCFVNLLTSLLMKHSDVGTSQEVIDKMSKIVEADPSKGVLLLPVYLYMLKKTMCPTRRLHILEALPRLATHKYNVAPVLKTIQGLSTCSKLKSLSIKLLTELWTLQDRCFPHLLKAITDGGRSGVTMATMTDDVIIAKALAIKEVCRLRPEQHGAEMLSPLSDILTSSKEEQTGLTAALCLQALWYICEAEVINILSAWSVLESQLISESRVVVLVRICELFSLVPSLQVKSSEYEVFYGETARLLWLNTQHTSDQVVSAAYKALSKYDHTLFRISHFKYQIVKEFVDQAQSILSQDESNEGTVDTVIPYVPGVCYMRLFDNLNDTSLQGYQEFLNAITGQEVEKLPRGIYFTSLQQHRRKSSQIKGIEDIPKFIQTQYENTKQPGLRPGLAASVLLCYSPIVEVGRDGRPRKHYIMSHGKNYVQMFTALLQDIPIQPSDWYKTSLMGPAWENFVQNMFAAMLQARQTEIDLQLTRDYIDEKEAEMKKGAAWLFVRDSIVDIIKKSSRGSPSEQFNCVLALSGLIKAVNKFYTSLGPDEKKQNDDITEYMSHSHWLLTVIDTCMSLVDFTHVPLSSLLGLCQQKSIEERLPASILTQAAAILTLCQITSIIIGSYKDLVYKLLEMMLDWLPRKDNDEDCPPVLFLFRGYSLGVMIENLVQANFADIEGTKGSLAVWKAMQKLEESIMSKTEHRIGSVLGLSRCFGALCKDGQTESCVHLSSFHPKLMDILSNMDCNDNVFQPLCFCLSSLTACGFVANILTIDVYDSTVTLLKKFLDLKMNVGLCRSIGFLCFAGEAGSHPTIGQYVNELVSDWTNISMNQECSEMDRMAALTGLMSLIGSDSAMLHTDVKCQPDIDRINSIVKQLKTLAVQCEMIGVKTMTNWLLGNLYFSGTDTEATSSSSPPNYSYLQDSSILKASVDFLIQAGKQGPEFVPSSHVKTCVQSLRKEVTGTLPPLNWTSILSPLMKLPFDDGIKYEILLLAMKVSNTSTSAAQFLSSWIIPPLFNTLDSDCQSLILASCSCYVQCITPSVLHTFLDKCCTPVFTKQGRQFKIATLKGLNSALLVKDPPASTVSLLYETITTVFKSLEKESDVMVLKHLSECLSHVPDTILDKIITDDCKDVYSIHRGTFIRCYLVANGNQPVPLLNSCIDATLNNQCDTDKLLWYVIHCFYRMTQIEGSRSPILPRVQWLLEITGHCRNIATKTFKLTIEDIEMTEVIKYMVNIIAAAICMWTGNQSLRLLLGVGTSFMCKEDVNWSDSNNEVYKLVSDWIISLKPLDCLSASIIHMNDEPWLQILPKIIEWLLCMLDCPDNVCPADIKIKLARSLQVLRKSQEYRKIPIWTAAVAYTV